MYVVLVLQTARGKTRVLLLKWTFKRSGGRCYNRTEMLAVLPIESWLNSFTWLTRKKGKQFIKTWMEIGEHCPEEAGPIAPWLLRVSYRWTFFFSYCYRKSRPAGLLNMSTFCVKMMRYHLEPQLSSFTRDVLSAFFLVSAARVVKEVYYNTLTH